MSQTGRRGKRRLTTRDEKNDLTTLEPQQVASEVRCIHNGMFSFHGAVQCGEMSTWDDVSIECRPWCVSSISEYHPSPTFSRLQLPPFGHSLSYLPPLS